MFRFFRRYQKPLIVAGGVMLMLAFTVGDPLYALLGGGGNGNRGGRDLAATAVEWNGGKLTEGELGNLCFRRQLLAGFLQMVQAKGLQDSPEGSRPRVALNLPTQGDQIEDSVLNTRILADKARSLGMQIDDAVLQAYLGNYGLGQVDSAEMQSIVSAMRATTKEVTSRLLLDSLREELLAQTLLNTYLTSTSAEMPQERWNDWLLVNDEVVIEAAAVTAESSLIDVTTEPTDAQLLELFEQGKDREPSPEFAGEVQLPPSQPSFAIPRRLRLHYVRANYNEILDRMLAAVTDDEIAKYYEENKAQFIKAPSFDTDLEATPPSETPAAETPAAEAPAAEAPAAEAAPEGEAPAETPATESTDTEPAAEAPATETPAAETPAEPASDTPAAPEPSAAHGAASPFQLVAYQPEAELASEAGSDETATESPAEAAATADAADSPAPEPAASAESEVAAADTEEYQPLEEVKDEIRRLLASEKASEEVERIISTASEELSVAFNKYESAKFTAEADGKPAPEVPAALADFAELAAKHGLEFEKTGLLSPFELVDASEVGRSIELGRYTVPGERFVTITEVMLKPEVEAYEPFSSGDLDGNRYIAVKVADEPGRVPQFAEVREQVLAAWKLREAAAKATDRAKGLASQAQDAGVSLKDFFANQAGIEVVAPAPFARYTQGFAAPTSPQVPLRLPQPEGLKGIGPAFLDEVMKLQPGKVAAVPNHDQSIAYVVRLVSHARSPEQLQSDFLLEAETWPGRYATKMAQLTFRRSAIIAALREELKIDTKREFGKVVRSEKGIEDDEQPAEG